MVTEAPAVESIECPKCLTEFPRPTRASTATCPACEGCVTLVDQMMDRDLVFQGQLLTRGKITIGPAGRIKANLSATDITIEGSLEGNASAVGKLSLGKNGKLLGDITAGSLVVAEGAFLRGTLRIGRNTP